MSDNVKLILNAESNITSIHIVAEKGFKNKLKMKALRNNKSLSDIARGLLEEWLNEPKAETKKRKRIIKKNA